MDKLDDLDDLDLLWCTECQCCHGPDCPTLGPAIQVSDTPVQSRAVATLPASLSFQIGNNGVRQVIARHTIANRTQFGPVEAPVTDVNMESAKFLLKIFQKAGPATTLDLSDENKCNWMCLVQPATSTDHQNLIAYQYKSALYYSAIQDILTGVELRVWYAPHYAPRIGRKILTASPTPAAELESDNEESEYLTMDTVDEEDEGGSGGVDDSKDEGDLKVDASRKSPDNIKPTASLATDTNKLRTRSSCQKLKESNKSASARRTRIPDKGDRSDAKPTTRRSRRLHRMSPGSSEVDSKNQTERKTTCPICRKEFSKEDFEGHLGEHGSADTETLQSQISTSFKCNLCALSFSKEDNLDKHRAICPGNKNEESKGCTSQTKDEVGLSNEVRRSRRKGTPSWRISEDVLKHKCKECNRQFPTFSLLQKHQKKRHKPSKVKEKMVKIKQERLAKKKKELNPKENVGKSRLGVRGSKYNLLKCTECEQRFKNETLLCKHLLKDHNIRQFSCKHCTKTFSRKASLENHTLTHMKVVTDGDGKKSVIVIVEPADSLFKCTECTCMFQRWESYKKHMETLHETITSYYCDICCSTHSSKEGLDSHMEGHERTELPELDNLFDCDVCKSLFLTPSKLRRHKDQHADRRDHVCEICGKAFGRADTLSRHKDKHGGKSNASMCVKCGKTFQNAVSLYNHMRLHQDQTCFMCSKCGKTFSQLGNYNQHLLTHAQQRQFKCEFCGSAFNHAQALKRHRYKHMDDTDKLHKCDYCNRRFSEKYALVKHTQDLHLGSRSCYCEHCGTHIKRMESYYRHMRRRHAHIPSKDYKPLKATEWHVTGGKTKPKGESDAKKRKEETDSKKDKQEEGDGHIKEIVQSKGNTSEECREKQQEQGAPEEKRALLPSGSEQTDRHDDFSEDGELLKALTKLKQTISKVTSSQPSENTQKVFPLDLYKTDSEVVHTEREEESADVVNKDGQEHVEEEEEENPELYVVVESHDSSSQDTTVSNDKSDGIESIIVQSQNQVSDPNVLIVNLADVNTLITLSASVEEATPSVATSAGQILGPVSEEQILVPESCQTLSPTVEETITTRVSPGPMLGNQSLISMSNETGMLGKQVTSSPMKSGSSVPKSTSVNSFISIESLLALPPSTSSSISTSDLLPSSLTTLPTTHWQQQSSSNLGNTHNSNFMQAIRFTSPIPPPKQATNFGNVSSLAMPSTSSGIRRPINNPLVEHQPIGQSVELSFLSKPMSVNSLGNLQQSTMGMRQFVPIAPSLPHISTLTMGRGSKGASGTTQLTGINTVNQS